MPLVDSNLEATWNCLYIAEIDGVQVGYIRAAKDLYYGEDHLRFLNALNVGPEPIALIGAGFGWSAEDWAAQGHKVICTDPSTYIQDNKATEAVVPILPEDALTPRSRMVIRQAAGGRIGIAITEDVMPNLTDEECLELAKALRQLAPRVAHWVTCFDFKPTDCPLNMKTLAEWKALLAPDQVCQRGSAEVL